MGYCKFNLSEVDFQTREPHQIRRVNVGLPDGSRRTVDLKFKETSK